MLFKEYKISKEMKQDILNFVLYPEKTTNSINKAQDNFQIMNILSVLYGKSSVSDKSAIWNNFEGFSNIEETKNFIKNIVDCSNKEDDCEISNLLFLYGCMLIHKDNIDKGKYSFGDNKD